MAKRRVCEPRGAYARGSQGQKRDMNCTKLFAAYGTPAASRSARVCVRKWRRRLELTEKLRSHMGQEKGFAPVCMWEWTVSADGRAKRRWHISHSCKQDLSAKPPDGIGEKSAYIFAASG